MLAPGLYYGGLQVVQLAASQDGERGAEDELRRGSVPDLEPDARRCFWQLKQVTLLATSYITKYCWIDILCFIASIESCNLKL